MARLLGIVGVLLLVSGCGAQKEATSPTLAEPAAQEEYTDYGHRDSTRAAVDPRSTFAADIDTASYTLARRKLQSGELPPPASVRVEEFVNYFPYDYTPPSPANLDIHFEAAPSPFSAGAHLVRVGIQGRKVPFDERKPANLTLLIDTSGSTSEDGKLALAKAAVKILVDELGDDDDVAIVAYGGSAGLVLSPTPVTRKADILAALDRLAAGGDSAMGAGLELAYRQAEQSYREDAVNRIIICSDGAANVGDAPIPERHRGVPLTVLGFGPSDYSDTTLEQLAARGDGNYFFIDTEREASRVMADKLTGTLQIIANDVKVQVEWTEAVATHRLLGFENRELADHHFRDDAIDGGEVGAGHQVTALYEIVLASEAPGNLAMVRVRSNGVERAFPLSTDAVKPSFEEGSRSYRLAVSVAYFAEILRRSPHVLDMEMDAVLKVAREAQRAEYPEDEELVELIEVAQGLLSTGG